MHAELSNVRWIRSLLVLLAVTVATSACDARHARAGNYRTISASLRNTTPNWHQTRKASGHPVGCGATAWGVVLGYWKQHKGKRELLDGIRMPHQQTNPDAALARHLEKIARDMNSTYGTYRGAKWGRTTPRKMDDVKKYIQRRGYTCTVERVRGTEFEKFQKVKNWLDQNRPVIVLINDPARAATSLHYPIIEKAELKQKKVFGKWRDRDVRYYVNFAQGGGVRKWIWVREYGGNDHPHTGSFSMFLLNIR